MANPFGGGDQTLSKNANHTNQANLVFAVIPRSASKVVEVINSLSNTGLTGAYDSDGYWHPNTTSRTTVEFDCGAGYTVTSSKTVISGWYYDSGTSSPDFASSAGIRNSVAGTPWCIVNIPTDGSTCISQSRDNNFLAGPTTPTTSVTSHTAFAFATAQNSSGPAQKGWKRVGGSNTTFTPTAVTFSTGVNDTFNKVGFRNSSRFRFGYLFVYNAALSDADINAIIDAPGSVLSYDAGSTFIPRRTLLGVG